MKLQKGDKVHAHYSGTFVNGEKFDASYDRGQPLPFKLGSGQVIKCWDKGFIGLAKGATADLICPPEYAYGDKNNGVIPANTPLLFKIEVADVEINTKNFRVDVTKEGEGYKLKQGDTV